MGGRNADGAAADCSRAVGTDRRDSHAEKEVQKKQHRVYLRGVRGELASIRDLLKRIQVPWTCQCGRCGDAVMDRADRWSSRHRSAIAVLDRVYW